MNHRSTWCLGALAALAGCGASVKRVAAPDGSEAWRVDCSASVETDCRYEAERTCPAGYQVLASDDRGLTLRCRPRAAPLEVKAPDEATIPAPGDETAAPPAPAARADTTASPAQRERHGLFARAAFGWGQAQSSETLTNGNKGTLEGTGLAFDGTVGTALTPIIMIGGTFAFQHTSSPTMTLGDRESDTGEASLSVVGASVRGYVTRTSGLYFGGLAGYGSLSAPDPYGLAARFRASGVGYGAEVGYHTSIGERWHAGAKLRMIGTATSYLTTFRSESQNTVAFALLADIMSL
jgi:hypothetical protein